MPKYIFAFGEAQLKQYFPCQTLLSHLNFNLSKLTKVYLSIKKSK